MYPHHPIFPRTFPVGHFPIPLSIPPPPHPHPALQFAYHPNIASTFPNFFQITQPQNFNFPTGHPQIAQLPSADSPCIQSIESPESSKDSGYSSSVSSENSFERASSIVKNFPSKVNTPETTKPADSSSHDEEVLKGLFESLHSTAPLPELSGSFVDDFFQGLEAFQQNGNTNQTSAKPEISTQHVVEPSSGKLEPIQLTVSPALSADSGCPSSDSSVRDSPANLNTPTIPKNSDFSEEDRKIQKDTPTKLNTPTDPKNSDCFEKDKKVEKELIEFLHSSAPLPVLTGDFVDSYFCGLDDSSNKSSTESNLPIDQKSRNQNQTTPKSKTKVSKNVRRKYVRFSRPQIRYLTTLFEKSTENWNFEFIAKGMKVEPEQVRNWFSRREKEIKKKEILANSTYPF